MSKIKQSLFIFLLIATITTTVFTQKKMCLTDLAMAKSREVSCDKCLGLVMSKKSTWENGGRISVSFLDGDSATHARVARVAEKWETYANVDFVFGNSRRADIKISFQKEGYWSAVGTDSRNYSPSMSLEKLSARTTDDNFDSVVLHEFGHALGLLHEHQNANRPFEWNEEAVYRKYSGEPNFWSRQTIKRNLLDKYDDRSTYTNFAYDRYSIMHYPIDGSLTTNGFSVGWNRSLSSNDKIIIGKIYPKSRSRNTSLAINKPSDGGSVSLTTQVTGTTSTPQLNHYLLVISKTAQRFYIQQPVQVSRDGRWTGRAAFGTNSYGIGHEWVIWVITTKSRLSVGEVFESTFPRDAKLSQPIVVTRRR